MKICVCIVFAISMMCGPVMGQKNMDWASLQKFRMANEALGEPSHDEDRVVFMGNSILARWTRISPGFFKSHPSYVNRAISGQTTPQMLLRFRQDVIDLHPKVVVILAGTNDIAGNTGVATLKMITDNIETMVEQACLHGIKVVLCSVLPAADYPWRAGMNPDKRIPELNRWLKEYAGRKGIFYLDYFAKMADEKNGMKSGLSSDGVHPTAEGYALMGPMVEEAINKVLND